MYISTMCFLVNSNSYFIAQMVPPGKPEEVIKVSDDKLSANNKYIFKFSNVLFLLFSG